MSDRNDRTDRLSRRAALQGLGVGLGSMAGIGCASSEPIEPEEPAKPGNNTPPPAGTTPPPSATASPGVTDPPDPPLPTTPKELLAGIEHIVVVVMENRSFDHFFGALALDAAYVNKATVNGLKGTESNPASADGAPPVTVFKMDNFTPEDPPHGWAAAHSQFNGGLNDGFVKAHAGATEAEAMGYHDRTQIPLYYWFADNFAICDNWFSSVMGPTWPNRFYIHATTSSGKKDNNPVALAPTTIWDALASKGVSAKNYTAGLAAWVMGGFPSKALTIGPSTLNVPISDFFDAAQSGTLPSFSLIDPDYMASDDHPSHNILRGQAFIASVYKALAESPLWFKTLLVITYDENGGFHDHVPPPETVDANPEFKQLGFRVPAIVIGATVKKGYVCKTQLEHSSIASTLKTRWDISSLTPRMDATKDISDCIDPAKAIKPVVPPLGMPVVAMTMDDALWDGVGIDSQPTLGDMIAKGVVPTANPVNHQARIGAWLQHARRLGAVRIVGG